MKTIGIVVIYHPSINVINNILSYLPNLDCLIVWNNSSHDNNDFLGNTKARGLFDSQIYTDQDLKDVYGCVGTLKPVTVIRKKNCSRPGSAVSVKSVSNRILQLIFKV